jgi:hypothetical protein
MKERNDQPHGGRGLKRHRRFETHRKLKSARGGRGMAPCVLASGIVR